MILNALPERVMLLVVYKFCSDNLLRELITTLFIFNYYTDMQVTGRILVLPPQAVLYLLHFNKKWKDNKSGMEDYFDFERLKVSVC